MVAQLWAVTGASFTADAARAETFKNTSGARGVTLPTDLKVSALPTPGPFVRVNPGGATLPANYAQAPGQSYGLYDAASVDVPVAATGSGSAVTKYLIRRITDPQFEGAAPANPLTAIYDSFVWVSSLTGLNYPYVELVKLVQPASTSAITNAMLTDIRRLTRPRKDRLPFLVTGPATPGSSDLLTTVSPAFQQWPGFAPSVYVPEWANYMTIVGRVHGSVIMDGLCFGVLRCDVGNNRELPSGLVNYDFNTPSYPWDGVRNPTLTVGFDGPVPSAMRGTTQKIQMMGNRQNSSGGYLRVDSRSQVEWDIQFEERLV